MKDDIRPPVGAYGSPPYALSRYIVETGGVSPDFTPVLHQGIWNDAFGDGNGGAAVVIKEIDGETWWRSYWDSAASLIGTGTDYSPDRIAVEVQAFFPNQTQWSRGVVAEIPSGVIREGGVINIKTILEDGMFWPDTAVENLAHGLGGETPVAALAGVIVHDLDDLGRPCLTLMVSGPGGAREAAMMIAHALAEKGLNGGICMRTVRNDSSGVIKLTFAPELMLASGATKSYGIDWNIWKAFARENAELEWHRACLIWCDQVAAAVDGLLKDVPLMVDQVLFDYIRATVLLPGQSLEAILEEPDALGEMVNSYPYECMFRPIGD